jgi:hypothetical protein
MSEKNLSEATVEDIIEELDSRKGLKFVIIAHTPETNDDDGDRFYQCHCEEWAVGAMQLYMANIVWEEMLEDFEEDEEEEW